MHYWIDFLNWYQSGGDGPKYLWLGVGVLLLGLLLIVGDHVIRRSMGQRRFLGTWYSDRQFHELMQMLYEKQQAGMRVLSKEESELLRHYQLGTGKGISRDSGWHA